MEGITEEVTFKLKRKKDETESAIQRTCGKGFEVEASASEMAL